MTGRNKGAAGQQESPFDETRVLIEFHHVGNAVKVTAVDPKSLIEATIVGDPAAGEAALTRAVVNKLRYVLARREQPESPAEPPSGPRRDGRGGTLV
jgi:hypothetical protein